MNYVKLLKKVTGLDNVSEIRTVMEDRDDWREMACRTCSSTGWWWMFTTRIHDVCRPSTIGN